MIVCNATPLICLGKINRLDLLRDVFYKVVIPSAVEKEVLVENKPDSIIIEKAIKDKWIKVVNPKNILDFGLGLGESAAICLAKEKNKNIIIDDAIAIKVAKALKLDVLRTTTVILMAVNKKIINKKNGVYLLNKIVENGYYINPYYYTLLLEKLNH